MGKMKRIMVIGSPGAGKSTFARKLRDKTGLPLYYMDMLFHKPDKTTVTREELDRRLQEILQTDSWIIDGNYQRTLPMRFEACTDVFVLDYPMEQCLEGAEARIGTKREDMPWIEQEFDPEFRQYILDFPKEQLPRIYELVEQYRASKIITIFHSREEADAWLEKEKIADYSEYWEACWKAEKPVELNTYLEKYYKMESPEINFFKENKIVKVCDAACGFGAYSLAFVSNGFKVDSFDVSETAVELTRNALKKYGAEENNVKIASIFETHYVSECFDGVIAHAVLDHLTVEDAKKALRELLRITKEGGLILLSFDMVEVDDLKEPHQVLWDGTMRYTGENRNGMLFHPYSWEEVETFLEGYTIVYRADKEDREHIVILRKG